MKRSCYAACLAVVFALLELGVLPPVRPPLVLNDMTPQFEFLGKSRGSIYFSYIGYVIFFVKCNISKSSTIG